MPSRRPGLCALVAVLCGCTAPPVERPDAATTDAPAPLVYPRAAPTCAGPDEAPLRTGASVDGIVCTRVGAEAPATPPDWPSTEGLSEPVRHVDPAAVTDGDGTRASPHQTLTSALRAEPAARSIVLRRGVHSVPETLTLARPLAVVGAGAGVTVVTLSRGGVGLDLAATGDVALRDLTLRYVEGTVTDGDVAVRSSSARVALTDVAVEDASVALDASGGSVTAVGFTARRSARYGVLLRGAARAAFDRFLLRDGAGQGLRAEGARVHLRRGLVADNARHGVVLLGAATAVSGFARCGDEGSVGPLDCLDQVVASGNGVAGLYLEDDRAAEGRRLTVRETRLAAVPDGTAGDGVVVSIGARLSLDPEVTSLARRGFGSMVAGNARVGVLAQGAGARLSVRGAWVTGNAVGGVFVAGGAGADVVGECLLVGNRFGGLVVTPGGEVGIVQCNGVAETGEGTAMTATGAVTLADGVHLNGARGDTGLVGNVIAQNGGFGVLVNASRATLLRNAGEDNRFGVGAYAGAVLVGNVGEVGGRERAPMTPALAAALR